MKRKRRSIPKEWTETVLFDPLDFRVRLARAKGVRRTYKIESLSARKAEASYLVRGGDGPYHVSIDLTGKNSHYCTCQDGARKIEVSSSGGSLCKHVIAILLAPRKAHLLAEHLLLLAKAALTSDLLRSPNGIDFDRLFGGKPWVSKKLGSSSKNRLSALAG